MINIWKNGAHRITFDDATNKYQFIINGRIRAEIYADKTQVFDPNGKTALQVNEFGGIAFLSDLFGFEKMDPADDMLRVGSGKPGQRRGRLEIRHLSEKGQPGEKTYIARRAGILVLCDERGDRHFLWVDTDGQLRISGTDPSVDDHSGRIVGDDFHINVKQAPFFATGDGQVDDTAAIQKAIDFLAAGRGGTIEFPPGEYRINYPGLVIPRGAALRLAFRGAGREATSLYGGNLDSVTPLIHYEDTDAPAYNHCWENMSIARGNPGPVFVLQGEDPQKLHQRTTGCVFRNVHFQSLSTMLIPDTGGLVGSLGSECTGDLDIAQVSPQLQEQFNNHRLTLSPDAYIEVDQPGSRWTIVDMQPEKGYALEYVIRKKGIEPDARLHVHIGSGLTFSIGPELADQVGTMLSEGDLSGLSTLFVAIGRTLSKDAYVAPMNPPGSCIRWKIIDRNINALGEEALDKREYAVWRTDDRLNVYTGRAATRIEGMLHCVLDNVSINGGVTALRLMGSHFTTINLHTTNDFRQVNAIDVLAGNATMISTRIEACEGGYGLRLNNAHNIVLDGIWFEGKRTATQIDITSGSYGIAILHPALGQPTVEHCIGLWVRRSVANVRVIGGVAGNFTYRNNCYALKVEPRARQIHLERMDSSLGFSLDGSSGNYWVEEGAYDVTIGLAVNGAQGRRVVYTAGQIGQAGNTQENSSPVFRIDDFDLFNVCYAVEGNIDMIAYGSEPSGYEGQVIRLIFHNNYATVRSGAGNIRLNDNVNFHPTAGATLSLLCDGMNNWLEIGRTN